MPIPRAGALAQGSLQSLGIRVALGRVLGQAPQHDALQVVGDACAGDWHRDRAVRWWRDADLGTQERGEESRLTSVA